MSETVLPSGINRMSDEEFRSVWGMLNVIQDHHEHVYDVYDNFDYDPADAMQEIFRTSFKLSAGSPVLQALLQIRATDLLRTKFPDSDSFADFVVRSELDYDKFAIPKRHTLVKPHRIEGRTRALWQFFKDTCVHSAELDRLEPCDTIDRQMLGAISMLGSSHELMPLNATYLLAQLELKYVKDGRPNRPDDASRYRSHVREHALHGKPTGNLELDVVMHELGATVLTILLADEGELPRLHLVSATRQRLETIRDLWEQRNAEGAFIDAGIVAERFEASKLGLTA